MNEDNYNNFFESLFGASQARHNKEIQKASDAVFELHQSLMNSGFTSSEAIRLIGITMGTAMKAGETEL